MDSGDAAQLVILIILVILSGVFSSAETSLTTANKIKIRGLAEEGNKRAKTLMKIFDNQSKMLSAILIGNNIVNLSASSLTTVFATNFATKVFGSSAAGAAIGIATGIITLCILVFGEITPKTMATLYPDDMALAYSGFIRILMTVMTPFIILINGISFVIMKLLRIDPNAVHNTMTETELRTIVDVSHEDGVIETEEREMINNVVDFGDTQAKEVMVPRIDMTFVQVDSTYDEVIAIFKENKFTRLPVYEETTDDVIGILNVKDLLLCEDHEHFHIRDVMRDVYFAYEFKKTADLMVDMRKSSFNVAVIIDEYGVTAGLITLEDLIEEIVGEIHDEYDEEKDEPVQKISDLEYILEGSVHLNDLDEIIGYELESEECDTIGGYLIEHIGELPAIGQEYTTEEGIHLVVDSVDKNRIEHIHVYLPLPKDDEEDDDEKDA